MSKPPIWAQRILATVCEEEGIEVPELVWWRAGKRWYATMDGMKQIQSRYSSGRTSTTRIHVTAGSLSQDRRLVFYHEMAHYVEMRKDDPNSRHDPRFFARVFRYVQRFGYCTLRFAKDREFSYKEAAKAGYRQYRQEKGS